MTHKQFDHICNILIDIGDHLHTVERFDAVEKGWDLNLTEVLIVLCKEIQQSRSQLSSDLNGIEHQLSQIVKNTDEWSS